MTSGYISLGLFVFQLRSAPLDTLSRNGQYRYANGGEIGQLPGQQFLGNKGDQITLKGKLAPEITGGREQISTLRDLAAKGEPQQLIDGTGRLFGSFIVTAIKDSHGNMFADGAARTIDFDITLTQVEAS